MSNVDKDLGGGAGGAGSSGTNKGGRPRSNNVNCRTLGKLPVCAGCKRKQKCLYAPADDCDDQGGLAEGAGAAGLPAGAGAASREAGEAGELPPPEGHRHRRAKSAAGGDWQFAPPDALRDRSGRKQELRNDYAEDRRVGELPLAQCAAERSLSAGDLRAAEASRAPPGPQQQPLALPATTPHQAGSHLLKQLLECCV
jgi:hypothetical protein